MIRITKLTDIWKSKTIPQYIADSMEKQLLKLCREWLTDDIDSFGAFFFAEDKNDLDNYREIGLTERIETAEPEWLTIISGDITEKCYQLCYIIDDGFAIYVFCEVKNFSALSP